MKKVGFVIGLVVILVGVILFYPKSDNQKILVEDNQFNQNTSLAFYLEDEDGNYSQTNTLPSTGYTLNTSKSVCSNGTIPTWEDNKLYFNNLTKNGTSCYLYFDQKPKASDTIIADNPLGSGMPNFANTSCSNGCNEATNGLYVGEDNDGTTYYFRGTVDNNWVKFAGYYWRIIRINGDGSVRIIYNGPNINQTGDGTQIGISAFNEYYDSEYAGYMFTLSQTHGTEQSSIIKTYLDNWYVTNLTNYDDKIDNNAGFCGDREIQSGTGIGAEETFFSPYERLYNSKNPTFKCQNELDFYTGNNSSKGNKALQYPIGLISADEVAYAGGVYGVNNYGFYLYTTMNYWTMTPNAKTGGNLINFIVYSGGSLNAGYIYREIDVRPVINLRSDVVFTGSGTASDPYVVEGAE